jgi:hypothetical protein
MIIELEVSWRLGVVLKIGVEVKVKLSGKGKVAKVKKNQTSGGAKSGKGKVQW